MAVHHSTHLVISRDLLRDVANECQRQAKHLHESGYHAGALFASGHAVECLLKVAICQTLRLDGLPTVFKTHDLEALILYSGFQKDLEDTTAVKSSFDRIVEFWGKDGRESLLYQSSSHWNKSAADERLDWFLREESGVIPWLSGRVS